jgi:hypothetical protein
MSLPEVISSEEMGPEQLSRQSSIVSKLLAFPENILMQLTNTKLLLVRFPSKIGFDPELKGKRNFLNLQFDKDILFVILQISDKKGRDVVYLYYYFYSGGPTSKKVFF